MKLKIQIHMDLDGYEITRNEVEDMAVVLADAYPEQGRWVSSFGFLTYIVVRKGDDLVVEVHEGYGYHGLYGFDINRS